MFHNFPGLKFLWFLAFKITFRECSMLYQGRKLAQTDCLSGEKKPTSGQCSFPRLLNADWLSQGFR